jgi:hypothetical protein
VHRVAGGKREKSVGARGAEMVTVDWVNWKATIPRCARDDSEEKGRRTQGPAVMVTCEALGGGAKQEAA